MCFPKIEITGVVAHGKPQIGDFPGKRIMFRVKRQLRVKNPVYPQNTAQQIKGAKKEIANNTIQELAIKSLVTKNELLHAMLANIAI